MTNRIILWPLATVLLLSLGCGGGGGGGGAGGTSGGSGATPAPGQYVEFIDGSGAWIDPFNLQVGQSGSVLIANYDALGTRTVVVDNDNWTSSAAQVPVNPQGPFAVNGSPGAIFSFSATANIPGTTVFTHEAAVPTSTVATIRGRVVELSIFSGLPTGTGIPHLRVDFFNAIGALVGSARTMQDGRFTAFVPTNVMEMMIDGDTINADKYNRSVYYAGETYSTADTTCRIVVGPVPAGTTTLPASMGVSLVAGGPPPPPSACS